MTWDAGVDPPPSGSDDPDLWNAWKAEYLTRSQREFCARNPWFTFSKDEIFRHLGKRVQAAGVGVPRVLAVARGAATSFRATWDRVRHDNPGLCHIACKELRGHSARQVKVLEMAQDGAGGHDHLARAAVTTADLAAWLDGRPFLIEEGLYRPTEPVPADFKVYVHRGAARAVLVIDRNGEKTTLTWLDAVTWEHLPWREVFWYPSFPKWAEGAVPRGPLVARARVAAAAAERLVPLLQLSDLFASLDMYVPQGGRPGEVLLGEITPRPGALHANKIRIPFIRHVLQNG
jgi:hypothetical protein